MIIPSLLICALTVGATDSEDDFFEKSVRPILVEHCFSCHGEQKQRGGVRLDGPEYLRQEIDGGEPAVLPSDLNNSRLLKAVRYDGDYQMPPNGKLEPEQIAVLEKWVTGGASWPNTEPKSITNKPHWSLQPVSVPAVPDGPDLSPIDRFLAAKQQERGVAFSNPVGKAAWIRRVTFDLTGLPPTEAECAAFLADQSSTADATLVDRLLSMPSFGERWGRHWLDVARYADTREAGFQVDVRYPFAWTYRDWVIGAFNSDMGFDQFAKCQIAADQLVAQSDDPDLAALGFLNIGRRFSASKDGNVHDMIDDRIDTICRGFLGLSVACARCHDHKFDPIPTKDYYSLYGVFAKTQIADRPFARNDQDRRQLVEFHQELVRRQQAWEDYSIECHDKMFGGAHTAAGYSYSLMAWHQQKDNPNIEVPPGAEGIQLEERRRDYLKRFADEKWHRALGPFFAFARLAENEFAENAAAIVQTTLGDEPFTDAAVKKLFRDQPYPTRLPEVADRYGQMFAEIDQKWRAKLAEPRTNGVPFDALEDPEEQKILNMMVGPNGFAYVPCEAMQYVLNGDVRQKWLELKDRIADLKTGKDVPPHAMVLKDPEDHFEPHVFIRGNPASQGAKVPQQFLSVATPGERKPFAERKGRMGLAEAIADPKNPFTARVWVNRVWTKLFGQGIVKTPSDFGVRGEPPTHPELLDYLASEFIADGWSTKRLIQRLVLSRAYRQDSHDRDECHLIDPGNNLLWKMPRRRLDFEAMRDASLAVAGALDPTEGGPAFDLSSDMTNHRRTVYAKVDRVALSTLHKAFDFANPDLHTPIRFETTVPQQAVLLFNHPFAADIARIFAARIDQEVSGSDLRAWAFRAYQLALGREPTDSELSTAVAFLGNSRTPSPPTGRTVYWEYGLANWDGQTNQLGGFEALKEFDADSWKDANKAGRAKLTAQGGQTTNAANLAIIRRWIAPAAGQIQIDGVFLPKDASAVAVVWSNRQGIVARQQGSVTEVRTEVNNLKVVAGETLDFFVEPNSSLANIEFDWRFTVAAVNSPSIGKMVWNSSGHFDGPAPAVGAPLTVKQQFAQVLLVTNEFVTLD